MFLEIKCFTSWTVSWIIWRQLFIKFRALFNSAIFLRFSILERLVFEPKIDTQLQWNTTISIFSLMYSWNPSNFLLLVVTSELFLSLDTDYWRSSQAWWHCQLCKLYIAFEPFQTEKENATCRNQAIEFIRRT